MSDKGPGSPELIVKRIETEISRMEFNKTQQELQLMELEDQRLRITDNIQATIEALAEKREMLSETIKQHRGKSDG